MDLYEFLTQVDISIWFSLATIIISLILGFIAKKNPRFSNHLIPIQNILVGCIVAVIEYAITKDFSTAVLLSGLTSGGIYDIYSNLKKLNDGKDVK